MPKCNIIYLIIQSFTINNCFALSEDIRLLRGLNNFPSTQKTSAFCMEGKLYDSSNYFINFCNVDHMINNIKIMITIINFIRIIKTTINSMSTQTRRTIHNTRAKIVNFYIPMNIFIIS